jgi:hypothetical protein
MKENVPKEQCAAKDGAEWLRCEGFDCNECENYKGPQEPISLGRDLRELYPHGHPGFIPLTLKEMDLHSKKNFDYAGGGKPTGNFDRVGKIVGMYPGLDWSKPQNVAIFYLLKQLDAYLWLECQGKEGAVEGKAARLGDISVYTKIAMLIIQDEKKDTK